MSADNWGKCPKCGDEQSLREDYEIGIWNGQFTVSYNGECRKGPRGADTCGFKFSHKQEQEIVV